ncbi:hypothetical protein [Bifidobacterium catenulatum]|uniref:Uncharacterized protein n=1 Tax=Bifidobacterium catenulatum PV20-2 TaxID=1447716 RepID=A0A0A7I5F0_9BIFI|nr:hypothetical protein AH68_06730 [Bifidobacterium catenulatum PV20-2]
MEQEERAFIDLVEGLRRKPEPSQGIRSKTDLLDKFGETLQKNLDQCDEGGKSAGIGPVAPRRHLNR